MFTPSHRRMIEAALPLLRFSPIRSLLYYEGDELVQKFFQNRGLLVYADFESHLFIGPARVSLDYEIWLHEDGSLHKYHCMLLDISEDCQQRFYVAPVPDQKVPIDELIGSLNYHLNFGDDPIPLA